MVFDERIRRERIDVDLMGIPGIEATRVPAKLVQLQELGASIVTADTPDELAAAMEAEFVRWWREEGGRAVCFGSDAHRPDLVATGFAGAAAMVEAVGFRPGRHPHDHWLL